MHPSSFRLLPLVSVLLLHATSLAAAVEFPSPEDGTELVWRDDFTEPELWQRNHVELTPGALAPEAGRRWTEGFRHFAEPVEITGQRVRVTWAVRTDRKAGEDASACYFKLWLTDDPARREQLSINFTTRGSNGWYMFYVDPGFEIKPPIYHTIVPPRRQFPDAETVEFFRITLWREDGEIVATAETWHRESEAWKQMPARGAAADVPPPIIRAPIADMLEGQHALRAISIQFPSPVAVVAGVKLEHL